MMVFENLLVKPGTLSQERKKNMVETCYVPEKTFKLKIQFKNKDSEEDNPNNFRKMERAMIKNI